MNAETVDEVEGEFEREILVRDHDEVDHRDTGDTGFLGFREAFIDCIKDGEGRTIDFVWEGKEWLVCAEGVFKDRLNYFWGRRSLGRFVWNPIGFGKEADTAGRKGRLLGILGV